MISYCIETALKSSLFDIIAVSTDSQLIAKFVTDNHSDVIVVNRPAKISLDLSISEDAVLHAINELEAQYKVTIDEAAFIQATSPFTTSSDLKKLMEKLNDNDSVAYYTEDFGYHFDIDDMARPREPRQTRTPKKREAGNAWAFHVAPFKHYKSRLFGKVGFVKISNFGAFEIDEPFDLIIGESIISNLS